MKIHTSQITERSSEFTFCLNRKELKRLNPRFDFQSLDCYAKLRNQHEFISLSGEYKVTLSTTCDICLEPFSFFQEKQFTLDLVHANEFQNTETNFELTSNSREIEYYDGEEVDLKILFEDQLILDLPYLIKCMEECKGICTTCGTNLNKSSCQCHFQNTNNPFLKLKDLV